MVSEETKNSARKTLDQNLDSIIVIGGQAVGGNVGRVLISMEGSDEAIYNNMRAAFQEIDPQAFMAFSAAVKDHITDMIGKKRADDVKAGYDAWKTNRTDIN